MRRSSARWWLGAALLAGSIILLVRAVEADALLATWRTARAQPGWLPPVLGAYAAAFLVRALLWSRVVPALGVGQALAALHVSLAGNHVLPLRLGEALRVTSVVRRTRVPLADAAASTLVLRSADVLTVAALAALLAPRLVADLAGPWVLLLAAVALTGAAGGATWLRRLRRLSPAAGAAPLPGASVLVGSVAAWVFESGVLWLAARWAGFELAPLDAVLVTAVTIAAQVVAVAPGGLGTYEAAATAALVGLGAPPPAALAAALAAHAVKTVYALVAGTVAMVVPAPALVGRLRLAAQRPARPVPGSPPPPDAPVLLFLPAHDERDSVAKVVARVPGTVAGRPVHCLVVDDGSTDGTGAAAAAAGAEVVRLEPNQGLGAAVRLGLREAVARGAAAVAFCDADGEYAPEELGRLVLPVLEDRADYVVGSRFAGSIRRMLPSRRLGNIVLTALLRFVARAPITDGQSGYRALSASAAAAAEVIHDFNYAQVLTLDLLGKGFRYAEVSISYGFRETGRSFVRLGRYLRAVVPAVHRELNTT